MIKVKYLFIVVVLSILSVISASDTSASVDFSTIDVAVISDECLMNAGIDSLDTIYFDLRNLSTQGALVEFPVYFRSDDSVYAMDFSFMYNAQLFNFDSITTVQFNFQYLFNYAPFDSTVYFTSYSLGAAYQNNVNVVKTRFNLLGSLQSLSVSDVHHALGYLNGDVCPVKIIPPSLTGVSELASLNLEVFPNPVSSELFVIPQENGVVSVSDIAGHIVSPSVNMIAGQRTMVDVSGYSEGLYIVTFVSESGQSGRSRFVVKK